MNCKEANHLLDTGTMNPAQRATVQQHLVNCPACREQWNIWCEVAAWPVPTMPASLREMVLGARPTGASPPRRSFRPLLLAGLLAMGAAAMAALIVQQVSRHGASGAQADTGSPIAAHPALTPTPAQISATPTAAVESSIAAVPRRTPRLLAMEPTLPSPADQAIELSRDQPVAAAPGPSARDQVIVEANTVDVPSAQDNAPGESSRDAVAETYPDWPAIEALVLEAANSRSAGVKMLAEWSKLASACQDFTRTTPQTQLANSCPELNRVLRSRVALEFWMTCQRRANAYNKLARRFARAKPAEFTDHAHVERALGGAYMLLDDYCNARTYPRRFPKAVDVIRRSEAIDRMLPSAEMPIQTGSFQF